MKPVKAMGMDVQSGVRTDDGLPLQVGLDAQLAELFEAIWSCERQWTIDDRIDAAIKYGRL